MLTFSLTGPYPGAASLGSMSPRRILRNAALALAGLVAAVGIGLAANAISDDSVGLSAQPLSAGEALAPPAASRDDARAAQRKRRERAARKARPETTSTAPPSTASPVPPPTPSTTTGDDHGGDRGGGDLSGSGSGDDGGGSDNSGHGSDD